VNGRSGSSHRGRQAATWSAVRANNVAQSARAAATRPWRLRGVPIPVKVKIESTVGTSGSDKTESKTEIKSADMAGMRYLGVKSVKMISASCR
jgi:hypothetical protein